MECCHNKNLKCCFVFVTKQVISREGGKAGRSFMSTLEELQKNGYCIYKRGHETEEQGGVSVTGIFSFCFNFLIKSV